MSDNGKFFSGKSAAIFLLVAALGYLAGSSEVDRMVAESRKPDELAKTLAVGSSKAMDFTLPSLDGEMVSLSGLRGKWVMLNFWATWCGPCVVEIPMLNNLYKKLKKENFEILAVNIENLSDEKIKTFVSDLAMSFPVLLDKSQEIQRLYGIKSLPYTYIIDPDGNVVAKADGMREWDSKEVVDYIRGLMNDPAHIKRESAQFGSFKAYAG
ncbi:hypothetical protein MNBD_NITROSPINAE01-767 [hydrothermal vent metagenome]|uniref:Thioredoxin domain-containing protein n=1 Tax=hydrothermal vent metagenome TaxID=652676 RepID=A0A3B1C8A7_9ZZZZ